MLSSLTLQMFGLPGHIIVFQHIRVGQFDIGVEQKWVSAIFLVVLRRHQQISIRFLLAAFALLDPKQIECVHHHIIYRRQWPRTRRIPAPGAIFLQLNTGKAKSQRVLISLDSDTFAKRSMIALSGHCGKTKRDLLTDHSSVCPC